MTQNFNLGEDALTTKNLSGLLNSHFKYQVSEKSKEKILQRRESVEKIAAGKKSVYGINTGFGYLSDVQIPPEDIEKLQVNFLRSHACGVGDAIGSDIVKGMMLTKAHQFLMGHSGVSFPLIQQLLAYCEKDLVPYVPKQGSVGASGDLAPLSHMGLTLIGEGYFLNNGSKVPASQALEKHGLKALRLGPKEGLSIANGTHYMAVAAALLLSLIHI